MSELEVLQSIAYNLEFVRVLLSILSGFVIAFVIADILGLRR